MRHDDQKTISIDQVIASIAELEESLAGRRERLCALAARTRPEQRGDALRRMRISFAVFEFRTLVEIREGLAALARTG